jgi:hypothetical protein
LYFSGAVAGCAPGWSITPLREVHHVVRFCPVGHFHHCDAQFPKYAGFALGITKERPVLEVPMDMQKIERALRAISSRYGVD